MAKRKTKRAQQRLERLVAALKADPVLRARWAAEPRRVLEEFEVSAADVVALGRQGLVVQ